MTDTSTSTPLDNAATIQAQQFFTNNFPSTWYQNTNVSFTPTKSTQGSSSVANAVSGSAQVTVPMTLMKVLGVPSTTLNVSCQAVFDLADTDIMFVLDTTGSMSCYPSDDQSCYTTPITSFTRTDGTTGYYDPEKTQTTDGNGNPMYSKLESLRRAVLLFDTTIRASADPSTHFRYGFVPYSSAVNVGYQIPSGYLQNTTWTYQSRQVNRDYNYGNTSNVAITGIPQSYCVNQRYPATGYATSGPTWNTSYYQAVNYYNLSWTPANNGTCSGTQQPLRAVWRYQPYAMDVSQYSTGASVNNPSRLDGLSSRWRGCIEELNTSSASSFNVSNLPDDLNPDVIPSSSSNKWRPMWQDAIWLRNSTASADVNDDQITEGSTYPYGYTFRTGSPEEASYENVACGMVAQRLSVMSAQQVHDYVYANDFRAFGTTYHDVGMIWGTRMLSPAGVFASDTASWPGRNAPSRSIVFMTDGIMGPSQGSYGQYGVEQLDQRVDGGGNSTTDYNNHVARFRVECDAAKARGITIYVVALGTAVSSDLTYCASPGQAFTATSTSQLTSTFAAIAKRVAKLRISQ